MKTWNQPMMETLDLNMTAGGGSTETQHDGVIYSYENGNKTVLVEEYEKVSGEN